MVLIPTQCAVASNHLLLADMSDEPKRTRLPNRRYSVTIPISWKSPDGSDRNYYVTIGFFSDGVPGEIFANGEQEGSQIDAMLSDACILVSLLLQHKVDPKTLAHSMVRVPGVGDDALGAATYPASPIGAIVDALVKLPGDIF